MFVRINQIYPGTPVSSTNKTDRHDITEILLKVALNTINLNIIKYITFIMLGMNDSCCNLKPSTV